VEEKVAETGRKIASHAVVFRGLVLPSPHTTPLKMTAWEARRKMAFVLQRKHKMKGYSYSFQGGNMTEAAFYENYAEGLWRGFQFSGYNFLEYLSISLASH